MSTKMFISFFCNKNNKKIIILSMLNFLNKPLKKNKYVLYYGYDGGSIWKEIGRKISIKKDLHWSKW